MQRYIKNVNWDCGVKSNCIEFSFCDFDTETETFQNKLGNLFFIPSVLSEN